MKLTQHGFKLIKFFLNSGFHVYIGDRITPSEKNGLEKNVFLSYDFAGVIPKSIFRFGRGKNRGGETALALFRSLG